MWDVLFQLWVSRQAFCLFIAENQPSRTWWPTTIIYYLLEFWRFTGLTWEVLTYSLVHLWWSSPEVQLSWMSLNTTSLTSLGLFLSVPGVSRCLHMNWVSHSIMVTESCSPYLAAGFWESEWNSKCSKRAGIVIPSVPPCSIGQSNHRSSPDSRGRYPQW